MKDNSWIASYLEEQFIQKFRENQYIPKLRTHYHFLVKEFVFMEKWVHQKENELDQTLKENEVTPEEFTLAQKKENILNLEEDRQHLLENILWTSQHLEMVQNLEREGTTHLFLGYFTTHFRDVLQRILHEKKPVTSLTLLGSLARQKETTAARLLFQQGVLDISELQHLKNEEEIRNEASMELSREAIQVIQEGLRCARKQNWSRFNTEHLLFGILKNPHNQACQVLQQQGIDIERLQQILGRVVEEEVLPKKRKEEQEIAMPKKEYEEQIRVLKEIRDLLREQGRRNYEGNKRIKQDHTLFKWVVGTLTFLILALSLYMAGFVFLIKSI